MHFLFKKRTHTENQAGQALVEFALSLPILLLFIAGIIDFGMILFSYSQASNSLRNALRYAEVFGYTTEDYVPYLDCAGMTDAASSNVFTTDHDVTITYIKASNVANTYDCSAYTTDELNAILESGDILQIELVASVDPLFLPTGELELNFEGQRTVIQAIQVPSTVGHPPLAPAGFTVTENCDPAIEANNVSFAWNAVNNSFGVRIYDANDGSLVAVQSDDAATTCPGCDDIGRLDSTRNYYAVAFNGAGEGPQSAIDSAVCVTNPGAPTNFSAAADCSDGSVTFQWQWARTDPLPTKAKIYDGGTLALEYTSDMTYDPTCNCVICEDCITASVPFSKTYTITAVQGQSPNEVESTASGSVTATCNDQTGSITLVLNEDKFENCAQYQDPLDGTVTITNTGTTQFWTATTGADGTHTFDGLLAGEYELSVPPSFAQNQTYWLRTIDDNGSNPCVNDNASLIAPQHTLTLAEGDDLTVWFGYDR